MIVTKRHMNAKAARHLTSNQLKELMIEVDPEGKNFWNSIERHNSFTKLDWVDAIRDNLRDFGNHSTKLKPIKAFIHQHCSEHREERVAA